MDTEIRVFALNSTKEKVLDRVQRPCMAINVRAQYNGGLLPDIILLTQCYHHRGTRLNAMKRFCICSH